MIKAARREAVYGASGSGKTFFTKAKVASNDRLVIFDPLDEYRDRCRIAPNLFTLRDRLREGWRDGFRVRYVPESLDTVVAELHELSRFLIAAQGPYKAGREKRTITLVVDELSRGYPVAALPRGMAGFEDVCARGRHYGINVIGISQRVANVNTNWRGNLSCSYFFRCEDHRDLQTVTAILGPEWRGRLQALGRGQYLKFEAGTVTPSPI